MGNVACKSLHLWRKILKSFDLEAQGHGFQSLGRQNCLNTVIQDFVTKIAEIYFWKPNLLFLLYLIIRHQSGEGALQLRQEN